MADPKREELQVKAKRAILVSVISPSNHIDKNQALDELKGLVETAGVKVVGTLVQSRENPHPATCLGKGKLAELKSMVKHVDAELIIFDNNLSPSQGRNIEEETGTIIVDRSELILDIFATHAKTYEAKLQVELAQLLYFRPRLKRLWTHLERIEGGVGAGRGPGEKQLETDRRLLDKRVAELKRKLSEVERRRERTVSNRFQQLTVSLVGYTNAGKSTLMNALTGADVYIADQLFATLDTRTRRWELPHWGEILLSDTVGFVRDLPHHLVASFKSTLEEARQADLLLHVVDCSNPEVEHHIKTVNEVLDEIGIEHKHAILVFNKSDKVEDRSKLDVLRLKYDNAITVSAVSGEGLDRLAQGVIDRLASGYVIVEIEAPVGNGKLLSQLEEHSLILSREYSHDDTRVTYQARIARRFLPMLRSDDDTEIRIHDDGQTMSPDQLLPEESIHEV
ncbi:GTPase HflX [Gimesia panareensis]|uniref:GTPase HflX n=1 Tax=Gimesia panareensis TaxID=2527978 RepID=A0A518FX20_9PLAN|nr:GTPase HflX [Gimesia panareensis]QDV20919.1 GTPase HflX [Gimesia panareensis]